MKKKSQFGSVLAILLVSIVIAIILFSSTNTTITNNSAIDDEAKLTVEAEIDKIKEPNTAPTEPQEGEVDVLFNLTVDVGCKIGLGNDKKKISPSKQWQYHLEFIDIPGTYDTEAKEIKDLDIIIEELVENWLENNVKNKGRKKKMLERYVIIDYEVIMELLPEPPEPPGPA